MSASPISIRDRLVRLTPYHAVGHPTVPLGLEQLEAVRSLNRRILAGIVPFEAVPCLCGGTEFDEIATTERYGFAQKTVICRTCGLVQSNPRMTDAAYRDFYSSDEYRRIYDSPDFLHEYERNYLDGRGELIFAFVTAQRPVERIRSIAEFGAGGGWMLLPFVEAGIVARGWDYSPQLVQLGRSKGIDLAVGDVDALEGVHDAILAIHVIEHTLDPVATLTALRGHLTPGGEIFIEVPDIERFDMGQLQNAHTYYFTEATLRHYAARAQLATTYFEHDPTTGHMRGAFAATDAPPPSVVELRGHYEEMATMLRRFNWMWRARSPIRFIGRVLDRVGLKERVKQSLRG